MPTGDYTAIARYKKISYNKQSAPIACGNQLQKQSKWAQVGNITVFKNVMAYTLQHKQT